MVVLLFSVLPVSVLPVVAWSESAYKYINEDGSVTYSDTPPANRDDYEEIPLREYAPADAAAHQSTLEQMTNTADRLQKDRLQREQQRQQTTPAVQFPALYDPTPEAYPQRYFYPGYRGYNHHQRPQPPYRLDRPPKNETQRRLDKLKAPLKIPSFGEGESFRDKYER